VLKFKFEWISEIDLHFNLYSSGVWFDAMGIVRRIMMSWGKDEILNLCKFCSSSFSQQKREKYFLLEHKFSFNSVKALPLCLSSLCYLCVVAQYKILLAHIPLKFHRRLLRHHFTIYLSMYNFVFKLPQESSLSYAFTWTCGVMKKYNLNLIKFYAVEEEFRCCIIEL
jgi:hypothetical protein